MMTLRRVLIAAALVAVALATATVIGTHWLLFRTLENPTLDFEVTAGSSASRVLAELAEVGLMPSPVAGRVYLALRGRGRSFHYGHYRFDAAMRPVDVLERILDGRVETVTITVVEGSLASEIAELCADAGFGTRAGWQRFISSPGWISDLAPEAPSLEGFLFPDSYRFAIGLPAEGVARHMVERFRTVWQEETAAGEDLWGSPFEVVVLASLVEAETSLPEERPRVAGVFVNRLRRGMLLQCDPTVVYGLKRRGEWTGRLLRRHWLLEDPYNTYRFGGLPPGPINSPGRQALAAAIEPEDHSYLYFVARPGGGHSFSRTLAEHNRAVARLRQSRR
jgi:UPF0755 protein